LSLEAKYVHTNLIARDWRALAEFYQKVFKCRPVPPERDYEGDDLDAGTGISGAIVKGVHLLLPGYDGQGPTLEIYNYNHLAEHLPPAVNRPGYGHIAFEVQDVAAAQREVVEAGGGRLGDIVTLTTSDGGRVTWCYVTDPEGNILELQSWA
jgi:predicted enzyme related to lactoylglutathione lyase